MPTNSTASAQSLIDRCIDQGITLATAESCTAGGLAAALAASDGAGTAFHGGLVTYSKAQKVSAGVPAHLIETQTEVSGEVATAMVKAALANSVADIAVAITGVAGPEPDEDGNPVGLVYVAAGRRGHEPQFERHALSGDHDSVCREAIERAIGLAMTV